MPRTFSLAALLLAITAIALFCGFAVNYPIAALFAAVFAPTVMIWLVILRRSHHPVEITLLSLIGFIVGFFLFAIPGGLLLSLTLKPAMRDFYLIHLVTTSIGPAIGTLLFGGGLLKYELNKRSQQNH